MNDTKYTVMPLPMSDEVKTKYNAALADKDNWPNMQELLFTPPKDKTANADLKEVM
jgi:hypothetical protein